jgi:hypothetical protein
MSQGDFAEMALLITQVPAQFVRARSWSLGGLTIASPVLMTMAIDGLVKVRPLRDGSTEMSA